MSSLELTAEIAALEQKASDAKQRGLQQEAIDTWARIVSLVPNHVVGLTHLGQTAYAQGDFEAAHVAFQRVAAADGKSPRQWINLALACQHLSDSKGEESALFKALAVDPYDLLALVLRGNLQERLGNSAFAKLESGEHAITAKDAAKSEVLKRVTSREEGVHSRTSTRWRTLPGSKKSGACVTSA